MIQKTAFVYLITSTHTLPGKMCLQAHRRWCFFATILMFQPVQKMLINRENRSGVSAAYRFLSLVAVEHSGDQGEIIEGAQSSGISARGKQGPSAPGGLTHGINDYTAWFAGDESMAGTYYGYDGPCPPWNDELVHHYIFTLYAIPMPALNVEGELTGTNVRRALENSNVLATATLTGIYTLNPDVSV
ncbi:Phospholipid-binding protein [Serratia plymuthica]|uniref:Phospholipid-binding protein n=1 Tax=Serratia plymuthica TaxID=82996 RepID=A0A2X4VDT9_SERPL|nr:Phospholipid-binding protein [Serratia plymuthica]